MSRRERIQAINGAHRLWGAMYGKPEVAESLCREVPPKRAPSKPRVGPSEHQIQATVISWWDMACHGYSLPPFALFAVPNGGARDEITGSRLKSEGVRRGVLDLILATPRGASHGLFVEMKVGDNKPSPEQKKFIEFLESQGYATGVYWDSTTAIAAIEKYLA